MEQWLPYGTALGSVGAFAFAAWRYIDTRRHEIRNQRFEQFHRVFAWVAGRAAEGTTLVDTQQALAVYELAEFPEYRNMSLPIIRYYLKRTETDPSDSLFRAALLYSASQLEKG